MVLPVTLDDVRAAGRVVAPHLHRTPLLSSATLGRRLGASAWLKAELFQKTGSFKPRGALNRLNALTAHELKQGVISVSAGNHAQGLAYAARMLGAKATVVMPADANPLKVEATRGYGAEVVLHGTVKEVFARARELERERGLVFVHPFDDPWVVAGQGTVGLEIVEDLPEVGTVVVAVGGGGLLSGVAVAVKALRPQTLVVGVEPEGAAAMRRSLDLGRAVRLDSVSTLADGLAAPMAGELNYALVRALVDDVVVVKDDDILEGLRFLYTYAKLAAEPAGAAAVGALLAGKIAVKPPVVAIVSGGNVDPARLKAWL